MAYGIRVVTAEAEAAVGFLGQIEAGMAVSAHRYLGIGQQVIIPGRVSGLPPVGSDENKLVVVVRDGGPGCPHDRPGDTETSSFAADSYR